ncbi:MAG: GumC family protein [Paracoccus sp. (in: a-proteobacteria)]|uniref:GumC family protein n=2 Tax=Paracoccus sp. TaxID=267 RepID=UPI002E844915|nr:hypothetical protein [Pseudomonadota bacterium]
MGPIVGMREFIGMLRRRGPVMALILMAGLYLSISYAMTLPRAYEAIAVIQVQPTLLNGGLGAGDADDTATRLRLIEQRLMARSNVIDMIERYRLFEDAPEMSVNEKVALFRSNARIDFIPTTGGVPGAGTAVSAMLITVRLGQAANAARVANDLAQQILTGSQASQARRQADLIAALQAEDQRAAQAIAEADAKLTAFRTQNAERLPENADFLATEQARLESQRDQLIRELQGLERERLALEVGATDTSTQTSLTQQLRVLEINLAQARATLAPNHPEVRRLEDQIEQLREGSMQLAPGVTRQVDLIREQEAALNAERTAIERRLPQIQDSIAAMPEVAAELAELQRQVAALEVPRAAITARLSNAELEERLIAGDHGERMVLLETATEPQYPVSSGRRRVAVLGGGTALMLALLAGILLELRRPILRTPAQVKKALGVEPIAVSSFRPSPRGQVRRRARDVASLAILLIGLVATMMSVAHGGS